MRTELMFFSLFALITGGGLAQPEVPPEFEAASVKLLPKGDVRQPSIKGGPGTSDPGRITITHYPLKAILRYLYGMQNYQVSGPAFLESEFYDITAIVALGTSKDQAVTMMKRLLIDRLQMHLHMEARELPVYALKIGKHGHTLKPSEQSADAESTDTSFLSAFSPENAMAARRGIGSDGFVIIDPKVFTGLLVNQRADRSKITAIRVPLQRLADILSNMLDRPVVDRTELTGLYDFTLVWIPERSASVGEPDARVGDSIYTATDKQLGLALAPSKGSITFLVVDSAQKTPLEN